MDRVVGLPPGMSVELSRAKVLPGRSEEADRWMRLLRDRHQECLATLDRERMAVEVVFRQRDDDGTDYLWWFALRGLAGAGIADSPWPIDADHDAQARRTKEPGWVEARPEVVFLPESVRLAVEQWALRDEQSR